MSGGEQQMCAIGRALMARPTLLLLDEPSMGLAPIFVEKIFEIVIEINQQGTPVLLVEQNALMALDVAHRGYVIETGVIALEGTGAELKSNERGPEGLSRHRLTQPAQPRGTASSGAYGGASSTPSRCVVRRHAACHLRARSGCCGSARSRALGPRLHPGTRRRSRVRRATAPAAGGPVGKGQQRMRRAPVAVGGDRPLVGAAARSASATRSGSRFSRRLLEQRPVRRLRPVAERPREVVQQHDRAAVAERRRIAPETERMPERESGARDRVERLAGLVESLPRQRHDDRVERCSTCARGVRRLAAAPRRGPPTAGRRARRPHALPDATLCSAALRMPPGSMFSSGRSGERAAALDGRFRPGIAAVASAQPRVVEHERDADGRGRALRSRPRRPPRAPSPGDPDGCRSDAAGRGCRTTSAAEAARSAAAPPRSVVSAAVTVTTRSVSRRAALSASRMPSTSPAERRAVVGAVVDDDLPAVVAGAAGLQEPLELRPSGTAPEASGDEHRVPVTTHAEPSELVEHGRERVLPRVARRRPGAGSVGARRRSSRARRVSHDRRVGSRRAGTAALRRRRLRCPPAARAAAEGRGGPHRRRRGRVARGSRRKAGGEPRHHRRGRPAGDRTGPAARGFVARRPPSISRHPARIDSRRWRRRRSPGRSCSSTTARRGTPSSSSSTATTSPTGPLRAARGARDERRDADECAARVREHAVQAAVRLPAPRRRRRLGHATDPSRRDLGDVQGRPQADARPAAGAVPALPADRRGVRLPQPRVRRLGGGRCDRDDRDPRRRSRCEDVRRLDRPRRLPALLRERLPDDDAARRLGRQRLHPGPGRAPLRRAPRSGAGFHRPQGRHVRQHPRHPRHRRQDRRPADRAVRVAGGRDRPRRRAVARPRRGRARACRAGAGVEAARDDAPRPAARRRPRGARLRLAGPLAAEGDVPALRVPRPPEPGRRARRGRAGGGAAEARRAVRRLERGGPARPCAAASGWRSRTAASRSLPTASSSPPGTPSWRPGFATPRSSRTTRRRCACRSRQPTTR